MEIKRMTPSCPPIVCFRNLSDATGQGKLIGGIPYQVGVRPICHHFKTAMINFPNELEHWFLGIIWAYMATAPTARCLLLVGLDPLLPRISLLTI